MKLWRHAWILAAASALMLSPMAAFALLDPVTLFSRSSDSNYTTEDGALSFVWPQYWNLKERYFESVNGSQFGMVFLSDQAETGSRSTKDMYVIHSTASGIFDLSTSVASRLSPKELVNYYIDQVMRSSINPKIVSTNVSTQNGDEVYAVEWSEMTPAKMVFINMERFIFHKDQLYLVHGDYAAFNPAVREVETATLDSVRPLDKQL